MDYYGQAIERIRGKDSVWVALQFVAHPSSIPSLANLTDHSILASLEFTLYLKPLCK